MKLSIIIPTLGRKEEVGLLLNSIIDKTKSISFEVIIVDQNFSDLLDDVILKYRNYFQIFHYKVNFRGLSKAKNFGIDHSNGEYICFPDDDCKFLENTIELAVNILNTTDYDIVAGKCIDDKGNDSVLKFHKTTAELNLNNFEGKMVEATLFARKEVLLYNKFDEALGVGAFHGAEEGFDLIYRLLKNKIKILYSPDIKIFHPQVIQSKSDEKAIMRAFTYRCGFAHVCMKHRLNKKYYTRVFKVLLYLPYIFLLNKKSTRFHMAELLGLISGKVIR